MQRFVYLDFFRFVFALFVALLHFRGVFFLERAYLAVDFFFVLSGFVLTHAYLPRADRPDFLKRFFIDRVARLYPLYALTLAVLVVLNIVFYRSAGFGLEKGWSYQDGYFYTFIVGALLLQNSGLTTGPSWNAPGWSISVEFLANIGLAFALLGISRCRSRATAALCAGVLSIGCYMLLFNSLHTLGDFTSNVYGLLNAGLVRGVAGIALGVVCYLVYSSTKEGVRGASTLHSALAWGGGALLATIIIFGDRIQNADFIAVPLTFAFVLGVAYVETFDYTPRGYGYRLAEELGAISYAVYVIHWPIVVFLKWQLIYAMKLPINAGSAAAEVITGESARAAHQFARRRTIGAIVIAMRSASISYRSAVGWMQSTKRLRQSGSDLMNAYCFTSGTWFSAA